VRSATKRKLGKDPARLAWIRSLPCVCCFPDLWRYQMNNVIQTSSTEAAHVGERGISQKCPDEETIPLCGFEHHREGKFSAHKLGKLFWTHWGLDKEKLLAELKQQFEKEQG